ALVGRGSGLSLGDHATARSRGHPARTPIHAKGRRSYGRCQVSDRDDFRQAAAKVLDSSEVEGVLKSRVDAPHSAVRAARGEKPAHYKVICISMYTEDLKRLDQMVDSLKARGLTKANRSALIRYALGEVDLDNGPKGL